MCTKKLSDRSNNFKKSLELSTSCNEKYEVNEGSNKKARNCYHLKLLFHSIFPAMKICNCNDTLLTYCPMNKTQLLQLTSLIIMRKLCLKTVTTGMQRLQGKQTKLKETFKTKNYF